MTRIIGLAVLAVLGSWVSLATAMFMSPQPTPVDRIIASAAKQVADHPEVAEGHYTLGRAHYLAWYLRSAEIPAFPGRDGADPRLAPDWQVSQNYLGTLRYAEAQNRVRARWQMPAGFPEGEEQRREFQKAIQDELATLQSTNWRPPGISEKELDDHALKAIASLRKAIELDPQSGLYWICLASLQEQFADRGAALKLAPDGSVWINDKETTASGMARTWRNTAAKNYLQAYDLSIVADSKLTRRPLPGIQSLVSVSAIQSYLRLAGIDVSPSQRARGRGAAAPAPTTGPALADVDPARVQAMQTELQKFEQLPMGAITPIVFDLKESGSLAARLQSSQRVQFDLNGDGKSELHQQWIKPTTAMLVWDPTNSGKITSGRQLFGSVTWWLFWSDGYAALAALDDNRDGKLTRAELNGLSAWFDKNSNGRSDEGEVTPVSILGITEISCRSDRTDLSIGTKSPSNPNGIKFKDGRVVPSFDWVLP